MSNEEMSTPSEPSTPLNARPSWERELLERLLLASVKERQAARRWQWFRGFFWLSALALVAALVWWGPSAPTGPTTAHTAVVEIRGAIASDADANAQAIVGSLRAAFEEPMARAVVLLIDSPGGSPVQAGIINDEIRRLKVLHDKKVYAVVEETCASAAYYIAVAADEIYADKASLVGSIGVLMDGFGFTGLMDKIGVERRLMTAGENKGFLDPFSPSDEKQQAFVQAMLDDIHQQFIGVVREGRGERLKETPDTFSGLVWNGQQAFELGLVDGLANLDGVARDVVNAPDLVDYTQREDWSTRLAEQIGASMGRGVAAHLSGGWLDLALNQTKLKQGNTQMGAIRKAVFPVGGLGTRFLPATKAIPKEMLPVVDKPLMQYAVEEAYAAGIREMIFVTGRNKRAIEDHFDTAYELEAELEAAGKQALLDVVNAIKPDDMDCFYVRQPRALGLGHAVLCAEKLVGDEPFAVLLADDLMVGLEAQGGPSVLTQMVQAYETSPGTVLAVQDVPLSDTRRYGVVDVRGVNQAVAEVFAMVEKPHPDQAPSTLAVAGRYILSPSVFERIRHQPRGAGGEIQLTDGIAALIGTEKVYAMRYQGRRYDCGSKEGFLEATIDMALANAELGPSVRQHIQALGL